MELSPWLLGFNSHLLFLFIDKLNPLDHMCTFNLLGHLKSGLIMAKRFNLLDPIVYIGLYFNLVGWSGGAGKERDAASTDAQIDSTTAFWHCFHSATGYMHLW